MIDAKDYVGVERFDALLRDIAQRLKNVTTSSTAQARRSIW
jgi:hypothetical protein